MKDELNERVQKYDITVLSIIFHIFKSDLGPFVYVKRGRVGLPASDRLGILPRRNDSGSVKLTLEQHDFLTVAMRLGAAHGRYLDTLYFLTTGKRTS